jgi:hypothetical protein
VLALGIANDVIVPADRAVYPGKASRVIGPRGVFGHGTIVGSPVALASARGFLAGHGAPCPDDWDRWGRWAGAAVSFGEGALGELAQAGERAAVGHLPRLMSTLGRGLGSIRRGLFGE